MKKLFFFLLLFFFFTLFQSCLFRRFEFGDRVVHARYAGDTIGADTSLNVHGYYSSLRIHCHCQSYPEVETLQCDTSFTIFMFYEDGTVLSTISVMRKGEPDFIKVSKFSLQYMQGVYRVNGDTLHMYLSYDPAFFEHKRWWVREYKYRLSNKNIVSFLEGTEFRMRSPFLGLRPIVNSIMQEVSLQDISTINRSTDSCESAIYRYPYQFFLLEKRPYPDTWYKKYYSYWENEQDVESKWQAAMVKYRYYNSDWYHYNLLNGHYSNHPFVFKKRPPFLPQPDSNTKFIP